MSGFGYVLSTVLLAGIPSTEQQVSRRMTHLRRSLAVLVALATVALAVRFVLRFQDNLHCTQYTSFAIAIFDMEPHAEEEIEGGPPLVYRQPFAVPLRIYLAASLLAFLFVPPLAAVAAVFGVISIHRWRRILAVMTFFVLVTAFTPNIIVGERFSALAWYALFGALIPVAMLLSLVRGGEDRHAEPVAAG